MAAELDKIKSHDLNKEAKLFTLHTRLEQFSRPRLLDLKFFVAIPLLH